MGDHFSFGKLSGAHGCGMQTMSQFEAEVPHPLREDLPKLLATGCVRAPAIHVLFFVFIGKDCLKTAPLEVKIKNIGRGKG
jgi:hypothetical protein